MEELILEKAKDLFFSYGLKGVSMDDVAKYAGISKKTIYKVFEDKTQIVQRLVSDLLLCHRQLLKQSFEQAKDAVDEVCRSTQAPLSKIADVNPCFFYELEKSFPTIWQLIEEYKRKVLVPSIIQNLEKGLDEGVYRQDIDSQFVADVRLQQVMKVFTRKAFVGESRQSHKLMVQLTDFYLHAIATENGKKLINKYLNVNNEKQFSN